MTHFGKTYAENNKELHGGKEDLLVPRSMSGNVAHLLHNKKEDSKNETTELKSKLLKYSPNLFKGWQERIFLLKNRKIQWFKNDTKNPSTYLQPGSVPQGVLNFDHFECKVEAHDKDPLCFNLSVTGSDRTFNLKAKSEQDSKAW